HRGYPIDQLAEHSTFLEVCYLLIYGELPSRPQMDEFEAAVKQHSMVHEHLIKFYGGYRYDAHPMAMMVGVMGAMASYYHDAMDLFDPEEQDSTARRIIGKMPNIASKCYKYGIGQPFVYPNNALGYVENFMNMMFAQPSELYAPYPTAVRALDLLFILHADHEQNASTSTVRLAGSAESNPYTCVAAGMATLWGRAHGGANEAVVQMLNEIKHPNNIKKFIDRAKDKNDPFRLMGFGHRVYKNYDPRAAIIRQACHDVLDRMGAHAHRPMFEIAMELERIALEDAYFIERKLYPNVDFYSGIILSALEIPTRMFTVMFALARSAGWIAHWMEMITDPEFRIGRPRQLYIGAKIRDYVPIEQRS
ncbi:MAG TPA: citrate synthase, partial [Gammaproteobacteria bacterium]|nr:citrate synthase [Gammaproteobacteria bacterium]